MGKEDEEGIKGRVGRRKGVTLEWGVGRWEGIEMERRVEREGSVAMEVGEGGRGMIRVYVREKRVANG